MVEMVTRDELFDKADNSIRAYLWAWDNGDHDNLVGEQGDAVIDALDNAVDIIEAAVKAS